MSVNSSRDSILDHIWPLREPLTANTLTFEEWVVLGADPEYPTGLTSDAQLTLLERAAEDRFLESVDFQF